MPVILPLDQVNQLLEDAEQGKEIEINLETCKVTRSNGDELPFEVEDFRRHSLLNGLDDVGLILENEEKIQAYEAKMAAKTPWI